MPAMNAIIRPGMSRAEAVERARDVARNIAPYVDAAEESRRLPPEALKIILDSGLTPLVRNGRYGGHEADWMTVMDAVAEVGSVSGSIGWCMGFLIAHQWFVSYFPRSTADYLYGQDSDPRIVTSFAPFGRARKVAGGYVVDGEWSFGSGGDHCQWAVVGALVFQDGEPRPIGFRTFLCKPGQFRMKDAWYSVGLRGSGSNNIVVEEAFIDEDFSLDMAAANAGTAPGCLYNSGPLYQSPLSNQFGFGLYGPAWAVGRGALESFLQFNKDRIGTLTGAKLAETQALQIRVGQAAAEIDTAYGIAEILNGMLMRGELLEPSLRPNRDFGHAVQTVMRAVDSLFTAAGARGLSDRSPLQRHWRDIHAMANHAALSSDAGYQAFGRSLMGVPPAAPGAH
jgi:3-hydroxy-9,10-secoandrosta-1,3,5(10)-triene-9,17-dione monooxygenase